MVKAYAFDRSDNTLHTTNYGWDCKEKPLIPLHEYIEDICIADKVSFLSNLKDIQEELNILPYHMKAAGIKVLVDWRKNYEVYRAHHIKRVKTFPYFDNHPELFKMYFGNPKDFPNYKPGKPRKGTRAPSK